MYRLLGRSIPDELFLSPETVRTYLKRMFAKLGVTSEPDVHRRVKAVLLHLSERS